MRPVSLGDLKTRRKEPRRRKSRKTMKPRLKLPRTRVLLKYTNRYLKRRKISRLRRRDWLRSSKRLNSRDNISMQMRPWSRKTVIESWRRARSVK